MICHLRQHDAKRVNFFYFHTCTCLTKISTFFIKETRFNLQFESSSSNYSSSSIKFLPLPSNPSVLALTIAVLALSNYRLLQCILCLGHEGSFLFFPPLSPVRQSPQATVCPPDSRVRYSRIGSVCVYVCATVAVSKHHTYALHSEPKLGGLSQHSYTSCGIPGHDSIPPQPYKTKNHSVDAMTLQQASNNK